MNDPHDLLLSKESPVELSRMGGKATALADLSLAGFPVPEWWVLTPQAFEHSLSAEQRAQLGRAATAEEYSAALAGLAPAAAVLDALDRAAPSPRAPLAVRSSGVDEDGAGFAFAGQFDTYLFVPHQELAARIADVWRSGFNERVLAYRREHGLGDPSPPAVLIQRMVDADTAGVAFSADPVSGRRSIAVVSAVYGLGTSLVGGDADADTYRVSPDGRILDRQIAEKTIAHRAAPHSALGVHEVEVSAVLHHQPALTDDQVRAVADLARRAAAHFGRPQDIEWAVRDGALYLLQSRPITSLGRLADPDGLRQIWDNSNIVESYSGITTPLTFTFALGAYEGVYREFCRILGVSAQKIAAHDLTFQRMLGMIRGRVYYNLLNWYRVLALLPGFTANRGFMEGMMGVREGLPAEIVEELSRDTGGWARTRDRFRMLRSAFGLVRHHLQLERTINAFYLRLNEALAPMDPPLERRRLDQLALDYRNLETRLLTRWDAPLVNDFLAMIFFGTLGKLTVRWCGDRNGTLQNDLVSGQGGMISAEPARRVIEMARMLRVQGSPELAHTLRESESRVARHALRALPELDAMYEGYLDRFGDRCLDELKLESATLRDDPTPLLRAIGNTAATLAPDGSSTRTTLEDPAGRAEAQARAEIGGNPIRRRVFAWVLANARARVRDRENLRFERTRLFGRVRRIFIEIGRRLHAEGRLDEPRDVFWLECAEILAFVEGAAPTDDLRGLARLRRTRFAAYADEPRPADRFETRGAVHVGNAFTAPPRSTNHDVAGDPDHLSGMGACPGVVRGRVRVIRDPRGASLSPGEILVAERTDPGWILLFPSASALLVERGSLLSHSAIVAREMGIPAIVSIPEVSTRLHDGDLVEMDGSLGTVRILERSAP